MATNAQMFVSHCTEARVVWRFTAMLAAANARSTQMT